MGKVKEPKIEFDDRRRRFCRPLHERASPEEVDILRAMASELYGWGGHASTCMSHEADGSITEEACSCYMDLCRRWRSEHSHG